MVLESAVGALAHLLIDRTYAMIGNTAKAKSDTFDVTGEFEATDLIKALNAAGFHVKVKK
jgi:hypothetical protein